MTIISWYIWIVLPAALLSTATENGTTLVDDETLSSSNIGGDDNNVTGVNYAENEIDVGHGDDDDEKEVVNTNNAADTGTAADVAREADESSSSDVLSTSGTTEIPRPAITLAQPPRLPNRPRFAMGPFFEDGPEPQNVTAKLGTTVLLNCRIGLLYDKTVSWVRKKDNTMNLLTVGRTTYSLDQRITLSFRYPNNWRLQIVSVTRRDDCLYECQIATHPTTVKKIYLRVLAPEVSILDEKGHKVTERYYKAGSVIRLSCVAKQAEGNPADSIVWSRGELLTVGITTNSSPGVIISNLKISKAENHHSGKYTCTVDQVATAAVTLHILNGELPAAIHGGCSNTMVSCLVTICLLTFSSLFVTNFLTSRR